MVKWLYIAVTFSQIFILASSCKPPTSDTELKFAWLNQGREYLTLFDPYQTRRYRIWYVTPGTRSAKESLQSVSLGINGGSEPLETWGQRNGYWLHYTNRDFALQPGDVVDLRSELTNLQAKVIASTKGDLELILPGQMEDHRIPSIDDLTGRRPDENWAKQDTLKPSQWDQILTNRSRSMTCSVGTSWKCTEDPSKCNEIVPFGADNPHVISGAGYRALETNFIRKDVKKTVEFAAEKSNCLDTTGQHKVLPLGDGSTPEGKTPVTRHPVGSHDNGVNMDIAYFLKDVLPGTEDSLVPACPQHADNACTGPPTRLDTERTARFIAYLHENPSLLVIGVDPMIQPALQQQIFAMCDQGTLAAKLRVCSRGLKLTSDQDWAKFHHHHMHVRYDVDPEMIHGELQPRG